MSPRTETLKPRDSCPRCKEGILAVSPSGKHLVCRKCGRIIIEASKGRPSEQHAGTDGHGEGG